jgi:hypothetical protein
MCGLCELCFSTVVGVLDIFSIELAGDMLAVKFAKAVDGWLWCNGVVEVELGHLDGFVRKMKGKDIGGGLLNVNTFLVGEGSRQRVIIPLALHVPC